MSLETIGISAEVLDMLRNFWTCVGSKMCRGEFEKITRSKTLLSPSVLFEWHLLHDRHPVFAVLKCGLCSLLI